MLKNIFLIIFVVSLFSCENDKTKGFKISGTSDSYITGSTARLFRVQNQKKETLDSTILEKGNFTLQGKVDAPDVYYLTIDNVLGVLPLIVANENFEIQIITDSISTSKIIGSKENDYINTFEDGSQYIKDEHLKLREKFKNYKLNGDKLGMKSVKFSYDSLVLEKVKYAVSFIKKHPEIAISAITLERITMAKQITEEETNELYNTLSEEMQNTRSAKYALEFIEEQKKKGY